MSESFTISAEDMALIHDALDDAHQNAVNRVLAVKFGPEMPYLRSQVPKMREALERLEAHLPEEGRWLLNGRNREEAGV
jgi:hypothetical protein